MIEDEDRPPGSQARPEEPPLLTAANDNALVEARTRIDAAVLTIARLIGRQIAREEFAKRMARAANDNAPKNEP